jgi:hypothetical protein
MKKIKLELDRQLRLDVMISLLAHPHASDASEVHKVHLRGFIGWTFHSGPVV